MLSNSESTAVGRERTAPKTDGLSNPNDERDLEESDAAVHGTAPQKSSAFSSELRGVFNDQYKRNIKAKTGLQVLDISLSIFVASVTVYECCGYTFCKNRVQFRIALNWISCYSCIWR